ncbi:MAG: redoxin domain-containing protein [Syntrophorhabdaceae bacterium]|nr:redoxin domain-containing protein [Syntrophorhabdaceae bacterium]
MSNEVLAPLQLGHKIRNFAFSTYNPVENRFEEHNLYQYVLAKKWLILYFYPADFTFVCPTELSDLAQYQDQLQRLNVEIISVSTDTKFSHLAWCKAEKLLKNISFQMASDPTGELANYFGIYDAAGGTALRGTFIISPDCVLVGSEINYYNVGRNASELLRKMRAYTYLFDHPEQACPAAWEEGQELLTPSEKLVGCVSEFYTKE